MLLRIRFIFLFLLPLLSPIKSNNDVQVYVLTENQLTANTILLIENNHHKRPSPLFQLFKQKRNLNRRTTAALLAFPFPFGIVGLHRIYLGSAPYVPVVYIATLGGAFGILPLIDCIVLMADQHPEKYDNNKKVFMWVE